MSIVSARLLAMFVAGSFVLVGTVGAPGWKPVHPEETLILLVADGPLTAAGAPSTPPLSAAAGEVILNSEVVPAVSIQSGLFMRPLYADPIDGRSFSVVEWPAEVSLRRHWHPVTERVWMIEGSITSPADGEVSPGELWEAPAKVSMGPFTSTGSVFVFLGEGPFETYYLDAGEEAPREGETLTIDPGTMPWQPLTEGMGGRQAGDVKTLRPASDTDRGIYLMRLRGAAARGHLISNSNLEGYVLSGSLLLSDPYHGGHVLTPGFYFRIPEGFPYRLSPN